MLSLLEFLPESSRVSTSKLQKSAPEKHHSNLNKSEMSGQERRRIFLSPPHMCGEEMRFVNQAFESNYIAPLGPMVDAFEREFSERTGIENALAVSSGTAAMHLALRNLGVGPGDEVFASTLTFIGSVTPIVFEGGIPVFIDSDRSTWNMNPDLLEAELSACRKRGKLPKAIVPTDLYGQCADLNRILDVCQPYGIPVICDSAEALGATYKGRSAGKGAKAAVYSFNGNKIITTSGGGMLASDDKEFIEKARFLSQQARDPAPHYEHTTIGYNYRMSNIAAAIGRGQLKALDERVKRKREIFEYYRNALGGLPGVEFMPEAPYGKANRWLTVILITPKKFGTDRETVRLALEAENIESRPLWKPMHMQPVFQGAGHTAHGAGLKEGKNKDKIKARAVGCEVAEDLFSRGLCLPSGTAMTEEDMDRVITVIKGCKSTG
jgi:dTDP-4-amino-4,6-dideoxygalactose transaminase